MSGSKRCPDCGSSEIVEDAHYSQEQLVCADCGCILTEGLLTTTLAEEGFLQAVKFSVSTGQNETISRTKLQGIIRVRNLCRVLRFPDTFANTAVSYYERAFDNPLYHYVRLGKKEALMGCCVYITCRQHHWPLTMATISSMLYSKEELFTSMYLDLVQALKLDVPSMSIQELAKTHCKSFRLLQDSPPTHPEYAENLDRVLERTLQTLELANETWLVTGRHPIPIITAAAYLSWQSLKPAPRLSCTFSQFCKLSETDQPPPASKRLKELLENFLKLASQLPWLMRMSLSKKTVVQHLGDILKHRAYLLRKALAAAEMSTSELDDLVSPDQPRPSSLSLPPCLTKPRKRNYTNAFPPNQDVTGEEDISDSEIEQYLRTPREIKALQQAQAKGLHH
ncbi:transcription factor IIIB 50 kDa subunit [Pseudophryne corroboree]|uniref:transcription factor IIIB 50 kDa subunit n=1 Tax=Pseudophryne corroboree TaxID=495146 RepID=UPI003081B585